MLDTKILKIPSFNKIFNHRIIFYSITIEYSSSEVLKEWFLTKNQHRSERKKTSQIRKVTLPQKLENTFILKNFCHG